MKLAPFYTQSLFALITLASLSSCSSEKIRDPKTADAFVLEILHINDTHSQLDPKKLQMPVLIGNEQKQVYGEFGGYTRLKTVIEQSILNAKEKGISHLTLHAGDALQGSPYFLAYKDQADLETLSQISIDAMVLGNHEFDLGNKVLGHFLNGLPFPILSANLVKESNSYLAQIEHLKPSIIKTLTNNERIGIVGISLENMAKISSPDAGTRFENEIASIKKEVKKLEAVGVTKIILISHLGLSRDLEIASLVSGIDVIIGGHSHTLLGNFNKLGWGPEITSQWGNGNYDYPQIATSPAGEKVCVAQSGSSTIAYGKMQVSFNQKGAVSECFGKNILIIAKTIYGANGDKNLAFEEVQAREIRKTLSQLDYFQFADEEKILKNLIETKFKPSIIQMDNKIIGENQEQLNHVRIPKFGEFGSKVAPLVTESIFWKLNKLNSPVDIVVLNAGGIRTNIPAGPLSYGFITGTLMPFGNKIATFKLKGKDLKETLEFVINASSNNGEAQVSTGSFPYTHNLRFSYQASLPKGKRLIRLEVNQGSKGWMPLKDNVVYKIAANEYLTMGKDGYAGFLKRNLLPKQGEWKNTGFSDSECFMEWIQLHKTIKAPEQSLFEYLP